jgi:hypothetical protein
MSFDADSVVITTDSFVSIEISLRNTTSGSLPWHTKFSYKLSSGGWTFFFSFLRHFFF